MKREEIISYVFDFVKILIDNSENKINQIILYGSVARGDYRKESDIDIFIDVKDDSSTEEVQRIVNKSLKQFSAIAKKTWHLRGISMPLKCIVDRFDSDRWKDLKRDIISYGMILFGKYRELPEGLRHWTMVSFETKRLKSKNKVRIIRNLYGYQTRKKTKIYAHDGIVKQLNGQKLGENLILIPIENHQKIQDFFRKEKIEVKTRECFMNL